MHVFKVPMRNRADSEGYVPDATSGVNKDSDEFNINSERSDSSAAAVYNMQQNFGFQTDTSDGDKEKQISAKP